MRRMLLAAAIWLAGTASAAHAADLHTPPIWAGLEAGDVIACKIANVTTKAKVVQVRIIDYTGAVLVDTGEFTLGAGQSHATYSASLMKDVRCHFHGAGSKGSYRAGVSFLSQAVNGNDAFAIPAS